MSFKIRSTHKIICLTICTLLFFFNANSQQAFIATGKIEYEKKVNVYKSLEDQMNGEDAQNTAWIDQMKKMSPEYAISYFNLSFTDSQTLYRPGKEYTGQKVNDWMKGPATENVVFTDISKGKTLSQKQVFENNFIIDDSIRKAPWKITNDTRVIAGIECRKATTIIMDSIFVFAFYSDQILCSGGPESFNNLPGMILGIAIPRLHTTWFATKIETTAPTTADMAAPSKGKKTTSKQLLDQLQSSMKDWGKWAQRAQWAIFL